MYGIINFEAFILAGLLLNITPGADTMYILGRSIAQGQKSGVLSALGIATGALVHCIFAAIGLSTLLAQSAIAFTLVKWCGAAYLVFLGGKALLSKGNSDWEVNKPDAQVSLQKIYISGILTNLLNPKVALFFLAFLPQFIDSTATGNPLPFLILGLTFVLTGTIWCLLLALFASKLSTSIRNSPKARTWMDKLSGSLFVLLGIKLALSEQ